MDKYSTTPPLPYPQGATGGGRYPLPQGSPGNAAHDLCLNTAYVLWPRTIILATNWVHRKFRSCKAQAKSSIGFLESSLFLQRLCLQSLGPAGPSLLSSILVGCKYTSNPGPGR